MSELREAGVGLLVSCLSSEEDQELDLSAESAAAAASGIAFVSAPITDRSTPTPAVATSAVTQMLDAQAAGLRVAVHCRQGLGRAPMVAAAALVASGLTSEEAWAAVVSGRGVPVPETDEQREWLAAYALRRTDGSAAAF